MNPAKSLSMIGAETKHIENDGVTELVELESYLVTSLYVHSYSDLTTEIGNKREISKYLINLLEITANTFQIH